MGDARRREHLQAHLDKQRSVAHIWQDNLEYEPCDDLLLLERSDAEKQGSIVIPDQVRGKHMPRFVVLKVGPGRIATNGQLVPMRVKVGQSVLVQPDRGGCFSIPNSSTQVLASESCVLAVISERSDA